MVRNAAPEAVGRYRNMGFNDEVWDDERLKGVRDGLETSARKTSLKPGLAAIH